MFGEVIGSIVAVYKEAFAGQVINNRLNPLHLAVATTGYRVQSQTLQVPDRFGFFSPGPPRLQIHEGLYFILVVGSICLSLIGDAFCVFVCNLHGAPTCQKLGAAYLLTLVVPVVIVLWIAAIYDPRRVPGYEWEDWKVRKD